MHPHVSRDQWREWFRRGHVLRDRERVSESLVVRGGQQYWHLFPDTVEPDVDASITILWEDSSLIVVNKPAPLPVHPCGRFNRNTLTSLLSNVYDRSDLRLTHRLDANTTGLLLVARTRRAATHLREQFDQGLVAKGYLVQCHGHPAGDRFECSAAISRHRSGAGRREVDPKGLRAETEFRVLRRLDDMTSLLEAIPKTGRTNQIRIHLWSMGMPVVGDPAYLPGKQMAESQTLTVDQPRMCLHAARLSLTHPDSGRPQCWVAPDPPWIRWGRART